MLYEEDILADIFTSIFTNILEKLMDDYTDFTPLNHRVTTTCSGIFTFQLGLNDARLHITLQRIIDAQDRFQSSPLATVANNLEKEVVVSSVFGTNTIEGGELTETETAQALDLAPKDIQTTQQKRVINIKNAYDFVRQIASQPHWQPTLNDVLRIHQQVYDGLPTDHEHSAPGVLRDNPKGTLTQVGNSEHGGVYKPPQLGKDIKLLLEGLLNWNQQLAQAGLPALIRAPLVHLYFELIHPFWDGNGRVGRVLEAGILYADGFRYAPFAQANFYLKHIHHYFALFNSGRKAAEKKQPFANHEFVQFFLDGLLETINHLHDRVNRLIHIVLFEAKLKNLQDDKIIHPRQYAIVNAVLHNGAGLSLAQLKKQPWYNALYGKLTEKTQSRDLAKLKALNLIVVDSKGLLLPGFIGNFSAKK